VVVGILVVAVDQKAQSFGHAWTEIHDGQAWQRFDATLPENRNPGEWLRYLPFMPLVNEGPGYTMGLIEISSALPRNVRLVPELRPIGSSVDDDAPRHGQQPAGHEAQPSAGDRDGHG
jgi:hypothetical protein